MNTERARYYSTYFIPNFVRQESVKRTQIYKRKNQWNRHPAFKK